MERHIKDMHADMVYNNIPYFRRITMWAWRMRFRVFFLGTVYAAFQYWGNLFALLSSRIERFYKKYKKRWIARYNPTCIEFASARETLWEPTKISRQSSKKLSEQFVQLDRDLEEGFSRILAIDVLMQMELMNDAESKEF